MAARQIALGTERPQTMEMWLRALLTYKNGEWKQRRIDFQAAL